MDKEQFIKSEAAVIIAKNGIDSLNIPAWITEEQKEQFRSLSEDECNSILREDAIGRGEISQYVDADGNPIWRR